MNWWTRADQLRRQRGLSFAALGRAVGIDRQLCQKHMKGSVINPRGELLRRYADALETTEQFLRYGVPPSSLVELKRIPLLTLKDIGGLKKGQDPHTAWDGVSVVAVPKSMSDEAFGVTLDGEESVGEEFSTGSIVICEPAQPPVAGKYVIAVVENLQRALLGKYRPKRLGSHDEFTVDPVNTHSPEVEINRKMRGFVVARAVKHIRDI